MIDCTGLRAIMALIYYASMLQGADCKSTAFASARPVRSAKTLNRAHWTWNSMSRITLKVQKCILQLNFYYKVKLVNT